jgi:alcohol dehydrogenase, propanol-preferring
MRALQISTWHMEAQLIEVEMPTPAPGQVVVRIGAAGACHSDLHMMYGTGDTVPFSLPFTLGHENAGWVHAVGEGVTSVEPGLAVAVYGAWGCRNCVRCSAGMENYCEAPHVPLSGAGCGLGLDGGMADYMLVPDARYLLPLPDGLTPAEAAPLTDAGLTPYHAIRRSLPKLGPESTAVVLGVGGLGHLAVQILKATSSAKVIALDTRSDALEIAMSLGADAAFEADDTAARDVRVTTGGRGADLVLDCVGSDTTLALAAACTRTLVDLTLLGVAGGSMAFSFLALPYEVSVQSVYWGSRSELVEVLELASRRLIHPLVTTYPLDRALDGYRALAAGDVRGRAVMIPNASS